MTEVLKTQIFTFGSAILFGILATFLSRAFALRFKIVNQPNPIVPQHVRPTAYLGGVGVTLGAAAALALISALLRPVGLPLFIILPSVLFLFIGIFDDIKAFSPLHKFILQAVAGAIAVALGLHAPLTGFAPADWLISYCWILILVNAYNFTDVCDGLVGGLSVPVFLALFLLNGSQDAYSLLALSVAGAACGFLVFNAPPASIFLGDAGSHVLGFLAAALSLTPVMTGISPTFGYVISSILIVGAFLFELVFITSVRIKKKMPWWRGSPDHFSLRLQAGGYTKWQTDGFAWLTGFILAALALLILRLPLPGQVALVVLVLLATSVIWRTLRKWEVVRR